MRMLRYFICLSIHCALILLLFASCACIQRLSRTLASKANGIFYSPRISMLWTDLSCGSIPSLCLRETMKFLRTPGPSAGDEEARKESHLQLAHTARRL